MTSSATPGIDQLCVNTIRMLAVDAVEQAKSGHPGAPMGQAPMAYTLWTQFLRHSPANPAWVDRDRFVLSAGHASMLIYGLLHLTGYDVSLDEIKAFRQWGSSTPGHPEAGHTPGVEVTTGPLGAGFSMAVGMAIAEAWLAERYNRPGYSVVDHYTYGICSDGDLMEGVASEAASLAGTLKLGKLVFLYDDNNITIDGRAGLSFTEDVGQRFEAYGWQVLRAEGTNMEGIAAALRESRADTSRPSLVIVKTRIAEGSPNKVDTSGAHGSPLGADEARLTREALGWPLDKPFHIPGEVRESMGAARERGSALEAEWQTRFDAYSAAHPDLAREFTWFMAGDLPEGLDGTLPRWELGEQVETRVASGKTINALARLLPNLIGGSADLAGSNNTLISETGPFSADERTGRNIYFGVREHAMGGILNGMAQHGGVLPFAGTFLTFSDYMRPAVRLAALMQAKVVYVYTHDSIGLGEDGPTHQPIEHLASLRAMPGMRVIRPADANETAAAWLEALRHNGPTALALTRQKVPVLTSSEQARDGVSRGAYVIREASATPDVLLLATGSEVAIACAAADELQGRGVAANVVSMASWEIFEAQDSDYRERVLPLGLRARVAIEAGASLGWHRWTGDCGEVIAIDRFGASAPYGTIYEQLGLTADAVVAAAERSIARARGGA